MTTATKYRGFAAQPVGGGGMTVLSPADLTSTVEQWDFLQAPLFAQPEKLTITGNEPAADDSQGCGCNINSDDDNKFFDINEIPIIIIGAFGIYLLLSK